MSNSPQLWIVFRGIAVLFASWGIASIDPAKSNLDWIACLLISIATGVSLFFWLFLSFKDRTIDWTKPFSLTQPFWPMKQYPIRYWLVAAASVMMGGILSLLKEAANGDNHLAFGATFLFLGIAIFIAIGAMMKLQLK